MAESQIKVSSIMFADIMDYSRMVARFILPQIIFSNFNFHLSLIFFFMLVLGCGKNPDAAQFTPGSPEAIGLDIYTRMACDACHSVNAKLNRGPTLNGQFGKEIRHTDGSVVIINDQYIRESIIAPRKYIAEGFPPIMPSYKPVLNEEDIANLIAYIKALK